MLTEFLEIKHPVDDIYYKINITEIKPLYEYKDQEGNLKLNKHVFRDVAIKIFKPLYVNETLYIYSKGVYKEVKIKYLKSILRQMVSHTLNTSYHIDKGGYKLMTVVLKNIYLNWTEKELPQYERTKHVHGLHPYLGKFVPQLPEIFLNIYFKEGDTILDPFMGSGTTLIEANVLGMNAIGIDISEFNCLMTKVKTDKYNIERLEYEINDALAKLKFFVDKLIEKEEVFRKTLLDTNIDYNDVALETDDEYIKTWYAERSIKELLAYKHIIENNNYQYKDVLKIILSRSARSARLVKHNELDWAKEPVREPYFCEKHKRTCYPTPEAFKFIRRYSKDTYKRIKEFSETRKDTQIDILHMDSRIANIGKEIDGIFTSPPYCGLIDYHLQHEYAYHFLDLKMQKEKEIGPMEKGNSLKAQEAYKEGIIEVFKNCNKYLKKDGKVIIVVNDKYNLYPEIIEKSGLIEEDRVTREVNRRTGRRSTNFTEDIIICRKA